MHAHVNQRGHEELGDENEGRNAAHRQLLVCLFSHKHTEHEERLSAKGTLERQAVHQAL